MIQSEHVTIFEGDVRDPKTLEPLFIHQEKEELIVIHTAGIVSIANKKTPILEAVNVGGTKNLVELSIKYKVKRFIYTSSVHAIPEVIEHNLIKEVFAFDPDVVVGAYAKTKAQATRYVLESVHKGLNAIVLHPSGIIGPFDYGKSNMTMMVQDYLNNKLTSRVNGAYDFVDVRDVADGIINAIELGVVGECYILSGHHTTLKNLFELMRISAGRKYHIHVLPLWFAKLTIPLAELYYKLLRQSPIYSKYSLYTLASNANFSNEKARINLKFSPRTLKKSVEDTMVWLVEQHRIFKKKTVKYVKMHLNLSLEE
jgi:dihydroflavonol-4-reductase